MYTFGLVAKIIDGNHTRIRDKGRIQNCNEFLPRVVQ